MCMQSAILFPTNVVLFLWILPVIVATESGYTVLKKNILYWEKIMLWRRPLHKALFWGRLQAAALLLAAGAHLNLLDSQVQTYSNSYSCKKPLGSLSTGIEDSHSKFVCSLYLVLLMAILILSQSHHEEVMHMTRAATYGLLSVWGFTCQIAI